MQPLFCSICARVCVHTHIIKTNSFSAPIPVAQLSWLKCILPVCMLKKIPKQRTIGLFDRNWFFFFKKKTHSSFSVDWWCSLFTVGVVPRALHHDHQPLRPAACLRRHEQLTTECVAHCVCLLRHESTFFCSSLQKSESTWLYSEGPPLLPKKYFCCFTIEDRTTTGQLLLNGNICTSHSFSSQFDHWGAVKESFLF